MNLKLTQTQRKAIISEIIADCEDAYDGALVSTLTEVDNIEIEVITRVHIDGFIGKGGSYEGYDFEPIYIERSRDYVITELYAVLAGENLDTENEINKLSKML